MAKNDIKIGSSELSNIAIGNNDVDKVYLGKDLVWERYNCTVNLSRALTKGETLSIKDDLVCSFSEGEKTKDVSLNVDKNTFKLFFDKVNINNCKLINIINDGIVEPYNIFINSNVNLRLYHKGIKHNLDVMLYERSNFQSKLHFSNKKWKNFSKNDFIISFNGTKYHMLPNSSTKMFYADWYDSEGVRVNVELIEVNNRENLDELILKNGNDDINLLQTPKISIYLKTYYIDFILR